MVLAPYFGNKTAAAPLIWQLLDPRSSNYIEPFCGLAGVLFHRPYKPEGVSEVINDKDGTVCNMLRAVRQYPRQIAETLEVPLCEADIQGQAIQLQYARQDESFNDRLRANPEWCDPILAAKWLLCQSAVIGASFTRGKWTSIPDATSGLNRLTETSDLSKGIHLSKPPISGLKGVLNRNLECRIEYLQTLAHRLNRVYILQGDWKRCFWKSAPRDTGVAIFLDPPYSPEVQKDTSGNNYALHGNVAKEVEAWCIENHNPTARIVLAGYLDEHEKLLDYGWRKYDSIASGSGYSGDTTKGFEKLWASPSCNQPETNTLF